MIRKFTEKDLEQVMTIWLETNLSAHYFIAANYWKNNFPVVKDMINSATLFVYEKENKILGFIGLTGNFVAGLFVDNHFQSQGIGKELLDYAKNKKNSLNLTVYQKNIPGFNFYLREGFVISTEQTDDTTGEKEYEMIWEK